MTWVEFRRLFDAEYRGTEMMYEKAQEFIELVQGPSSVKEYATRFNALARFVPGLAGTELGRVQKFIHGLHPTIARDVLTSPYPPQQCSAA